MKKYYISAIIFGLFTIPLHATSIIANINGEPISDTDITARTKLMARQGRTSVDNRRVALQNIIDDNIKVEYASNFNAVPDEKTVDTELKKMNLGVLPASEITMAKRALRAEMAWQMVVARTIMPTIKISDEQIASETADLARTHGLPIEMTIIRLIDIPSDIAAKLSKPSSCDNAMEIAERFGGAPQKFTAAQYELSADIRERVAALAKLTWSPVVDRSVLLVCNTKKMPEYKNLDKTIKQNAIFKQAMFTADQQLKQLRRKAVIIINDDRYKL